MAKFAHHKLTFTIAGVGGGAKEFYFLADTNAYDGIETETGVTLSTSETEKSMPICTVEALLGSSVASRLVVELEPVSGKARRREIICASDKADSAKTDLLNKTINGKAIKKVVSPRRAVFKS